MNADRPSVRRSAHGRATIVLVLLATLLAACAHKRAHRSVRSPRCDQTSGYDVLIVGAGLAGLAAGKELTHLGHTVLILEATDRVGGRGFVGEVRVGPPGTTPVPIDYGGGLDPRGGYQSADPSGGRDGLRTYPQRVRHAVLSRRAGGPTRSSWSNSTNSTKPMKRPSPPGRRRSSTRWRSRSELVTAASGVWAGDLPAAALCARASSAPSPTTKCRAACANGPTPWRREPSKPDSFCAEAPRRDPSHQRTSRPTTSRPRTGFRTLVPLLVATAGPLETAAELDASSAVDAAGFEAGEDDLVDKGMGSFVQAYGEALPICLNTPVTRISYDEAGVVIHAGGRRYAGTHVLVTVPVGVLQAEGIHFEPELPVWKREAIDQLRMGHMQKVIIPFAEDIFRDEAPNSWVLVEDVVDPAEKALAANAGLDIQQQDRRVMGFVFKPLDANIAIGFYGGEWAELFERQCAGKEHTSRAAQRERLRRHGDRRGRPGAVGNVRCRRGRARDPVRSDPRHPLEPRALHPGRLFGAAARLVASAGSPGPPGGRRCAGGRPPCACFSPVRHAPGRSTTVPSQGPSRPASRPPETSTSSCRRRSATKEVVRRPVLSAAPARR